jgi:hypothetical protein
MPDCLVLSGTGDLEKIPAFREGRFYVQDAAAKLSVLCAQLPQNSRVLDCCAAPGGKSFASAIAMGGTGSITSCDVHPHKIKLIESGAARLGIGNLTAQVMDASQPNADWVGGFDAVIAGYGTDVTLYEGVGEAAFWSNVTNELLVYANEYALGVAVSCADTTMIEAYARQVADIVVKSLQPQQ